MAQSSNILLGKITKIHGFGGAVTVRLEKNFSENIPPVESIFLEIDGREVPFFIDYLDQVNSDKAYLRLQDYDTIEKVKEFIGCKLLISASPEYSSQNNNDINLQGYTIVSADNKKVGEVREIIKNPSQWILRADSGHGSEILIPFHEDLILGIDEENKTISMNLPDGLVDIN